MTNNQPSFDVIEAAIKRLGSQKNLSEVIGVSKQMVTLWKKSGRVTGNINEFSKITGIPRWLVRPDLYPPEKEQITDTGKKLISMWQENGQVVGDVATFSDLTGIPRWLVRPDLYPPDKEPLFINGQLMRVISAGKRKKLAQIGAEA